MKSMKRSWKITGLNIMPKRKRLISENICVLIESEVTVINNNWSFVMYERPTLDDEPKPHFAGKNC